MKSYYQPGAHRAAEVRNLFGAIAPRYDFINDLQSFWLHRLWKRQLVRLAAPKSAEWALDICCGTGDIAAELARRGAKVSGLDFSGEMLKVAARRNRSVLWVQGDAQQIPFADGSFDIVTVGYGLRNLVEWQHGLAEMRRVAKSGARLLILDFGKPQNAFWRSIYFSYLRLAVPLHGRAFCGNSAAYAYILESLQHYPAQEGVALELKNIGCTDVRTINLLGGIMSIHFARNRT
ncbi:MAG TPA: bifunctional demethylmenaquinone methyltransferase/2-methoxy-6-polyprenyl-1,4-benzoquinol methylase UbiE [Verrucomicrobiae bacterium]|nr:bifunctional demethylmenaquinone methyltransferase/2-methoxy-6-polyprenyl-1,4-benzoquinol methylase UbiE [Verrucomicrobiae bacterium]